MLVRDSEQPHGWVPRRQLCKGEWVLESLKVLQNLSRVSRFRRLSSVELPCRVQSIRLVN